MSLFGEVFGKGKCLIGFHDWFDWQYEKPDKCNQVRHCKRDRSHTQTRVEHRWGAFKYKKDDNCMQIRVCERCDSSEERLDHKGWSDWRYVNPSECNQSRSCVRCSTVENQIVHVWDIWKHESPTSCDQVRHCRRCSTGMEQRKARAEDHRWQPEKKIDCHRMETKCGRCSESTIRWGDFHSLKQSGKKETSGAFTKIYLKCEDCGHLDERLE